MKFQMAKNSLFAVLLRSHWGISAAVGAALTALALALLPAEYRVFGAMSALPFVVIAVMSAKRSWHKPSAAKLEQATQVLTAMPWPAFAQLLEQAFQRDGYSVQRGRGDAVDFELERKGRRMLVQARRWKSARTGLEPLRALQAARETSDAPDALVIGLGDLTDTARPFAARHSIAVWQAAELVETLRGLLPAARKGP